MSTESWPLPRGAGLRAHREVPGGQLGSAVSAARGLGELPLRGDSHPGRPYLCPRRCRWTTAGQVRASASVPPEAGLGWSPLPEPRAPGVPSSIARGLGTARCLEEWGAALSKIQGTEEGGELRQVIQLWGEDPSNVGGSLSEAGALRSREAVHSVNSRTRAADRRLPHSGSALGASAPGAPHGQPRSPCAGSELALLASWRARGTGAWARAELSSQLGPPDLRSDAATDGREVSNPSCVCVSLRAPKLPVCLVLKSYPSTVTRDKIAAASSITAGCYPSLQLYDECQLCADTKSLPPGFCDVSEGL